MIRDIIKVSPIVIPEELNLVREAPRPVEFRQPDYEQRFDYRTLIYDVFRYRDEIAAVGPPLLSLADAARTFQYVVQDQPQTCVFADMNRMSRWTFTAGTKSPLLKPFGSRKPLSQRSYFGLRKLLGLGGKSSIAAHGGQLTVSFGNGLTRNARIGANGRHIFAGKRCMLTKSKNNDLRWIRDWAEFHVRVQKANAVLLYDNGSDLYQSSDILNELSTIQRLDVAVVVEWPFMWGPHGQESGIWDSDFAQHGVLEHARWRFLQLADGVVYQDIDELAISQRSVFEIAAQSPTGTVSYDGRWIENIAHTKEAPTRRPVHSDFCYFNPEAERASTKWCTVPKRNHRSRQWRVHWIKPFDETKEVELRHFRGITTEWKHKRPAIPYDPDVYKEDTELTQFFARD